MFTAGPVLIILTAMDELRNQTLHERPGPDFMSEMGDDLEYIPRNERLGRAGRIRKKQNRRWLLLAAAAVLVLIVVWVMFFDGEPSRETEKTLGAALVRMDARLNELEEKIARLEARLGPDSPEKEGPMAGTRTPQEYHIVSPGDSLSAIAVKYGLTVDMLCQLNRIEVDEPIKPGQKLLVSPN